MIMSAACTAGAHQDCSGVLLIRLMNGPLELSQTSDRCVCECHFKQAVNDWLGEREDAGATFLPAIESAMAGAYAYPHLAPSIRSALDDWARTGNQHGGFVMALLENDLFGAITRADGFNGQRDALRDAVWYIHAELPSSCSGSRKAVQEWPALARVLGPELGGEG